MTVTDYVPHTDDDRAHMLNSIGAASMSALFDDIPERLRFPDLDLPEGCSESSLERIIDTIARKNTTVQNGLSFLGAGSYQHHIPAIVDDILRRSEFYTSYTPYQPELSQGMLQATFEYQTMICRLTGMQVSNASHYDGASALAEAILMAVHIAHRKDGHILVAPSVNPAMRTVASTYLQGIPTSLRIPEHPANTVQLIDLISDDSVAVVVQQPDFFGSIHDLHEIAAAIHKVRGLLIVVVDPIYLGRFTPPAAYGADIVVGEGQCLGMPTNFGGPGLGIMATRQKFARQMAGRLVGQTVDRAGDRGFVLTLATREQHIRRERATSNICTNAALSALASAVYLSTLGKTGLRDLATLCFQRAHYAAEKLNAIPQVIVNPWFSDDDFFREFVVQLPISATEANQRLFNECGIIGGYPIGQDFPELPNHLLVAVTDVNTREHIDSLVDALSQILSR